jgi:hypothetical protein
MMEGANQLQYIVRPLVNVTMHPQYIFIIITIINKTIQLGGLACTFIPATGRHK